MNNQKIDNYMNGKILNIELAMKDYNNYIYKIIKNKYNNFSDEDIEEIILDVFLTLWNNQNKLDINQKMSSYIAGITKNLIKKKYRTNNNDEDIEDYENQIIDISNIEVNFIQREKSRIINNELNSMKLEDKDIFIKYYYWGQSIKEISNSFNISESKVKSKLFRTRKKLHKTLKKRGYISSEE